MAPRLRKFAAPREIRSDGLGLISAIAENFRALLGWSKRLTRKLDAYLDVFNGTFLESFDALVTSSNGTTVECDIEQSGGGDLTMRFSSGEFTLDCTPTAAQISLTAGTDANPTDNYVYIPESTKVLTVSTSGWPSEEHIKVTYAYVNSAATIQSDGGPFINQNWNDHAKGTDGQGHLAHMADRSRRLGAIWFSGVAGNGTSDYVTISGNTVYWKSTAGVIYQMHTHAFPAVDTSSGDDVHVVNWSGDAFHDVTNLYDIQADSTGASFVSNQYFNLVFWGVANKGGQYEPIMVNLPSGTYAVESDATLDVDGYDNYTIPRQFNLDSSTGFLICRMTFRKKATTWEYVATTDLRGQSPATVTGGGAGGVTTDFADTQFTVFNATDNTKVLDFDVSGVTTGTTRTVTIPDADGTIEYEGHTHVEADVTDLDHAGPIATHASDPNAHHNQNHDLDSHTDVAIALPAGGQVIHYVAGSGLWVNDTLAGAGISAVGHAHTESDISDLDHLTGAEALTYILANDGAGSTLDADLLDGVELAAIQTEIDTDISTHAGAVDPHGDRAYADSLDHDHATPIGVHAAVADAHHAKYTDAEATTQAEAAIAAASVDDLLDVVITGTPADNEVMAWDTGTSKWINQTAAEAGVSATGHSHTESDISDLDHDAAKLQGVAMDASVGSPSDGNILVYRSAGGDWVLEAKPASGSTPAINDITDITITGPVADNEVLAYDTGSGNWINQTAAEAGVSATGHAHTESDISDLDHYTDADVDTHLAASSVELFGDVNIDGTPADNELLAFDTVSGDWINQTAAEAGVSATGHAHTESDISDLDHYTDSDVDTHLAASSVELFGDVNIDGTPADNEVLAFDTASGDWINQTAAEAALATASHTHTLHAGISDVSAATPTNLDILQYTTSSGWINRDREVAGLLLAAKKATVHDQYDATHTPSGTSAETVTTMTITNPGRAVKLIVNGMLQYDDNTNSNTNVQAWVEISDNGGSTWVAATNASTGRASVGTTPGRWATVAYAAYYTGTPSGDIHIRLQVQVAATGGAVDSSEFTAVME